MTAVELPFGDTREWNPYFVAFAAAQGLAPEQMQRGEAENARFMAWMTRMWAVWMDLNGITTSTEKWGRAAEFGAWLAAEYPAVTE